MAKSTNSTKNTVKRGRPAINIELDAPIEVAASAAGVFIVTEISGPKAMQGKSATLGLNADDAEAFANRILQAVEFSRLAGQTAAF